MKYLKYIVILLLVFSPTVFANGESGDEPISQTRKEFKLYPNPVLGDEFTIDASEEIIEVKILNLLGQQVFHSPFVQNKSVQIELNTTEKGLYLVQIKTRDNRVTTKRILFK